MKIIIDSRESSLWEGGFAPQDGPLRGSLNLNPGIVPPIITKEQLLIGDCHIVNDKDEVIMVIERKTLADLASSIHDGRWAEQKYRALSEYQNKLFYIIEVENFSDIFEYQPYKSNITKEAILSATTNLWVNHNIPYLYLQGIEQIAKYIYKMSAQFEKQKKEIDIMNEYSSFLLNSILPKKRENMTPENYFLFCLRGIPGISNKTAQNIKELFDTYLDFIEYIKTYDSETFGKKYKECHGRALNKEVVKSLYRLLNRF